MNKQEFLRGLGIVPPEDKTVTTLTVPEDKLEKVVDKETAAKPDSEPQASDDEVNALKSRLAELEKSQRDGEDVKEQLSGINNVIAELQGQVKASPAIIQGEQILDSLEKLQHRYSELEAEIEAAKCPDCGNIVGWNVLPAEQYDESEVNGNKKPLLPRFIIPLVYGKRCPVCKHFEEVKKG